MKLLHFSILLLAATTLHAQMPPPQCGPTVIGKGPNIIVTRSDTCVVLPPAPPSSWSIIKAIAEPPNDWALKRVLKGPSPTGPASNGFGHSDGGNNPTHSKPSSGARPVHRSRGMEGTSVRPSWPEAYGLPTDINSAYRPPCQPTSNA